MEGGGDDNVGLKADHCQSCYRPSVEDDTHILDVLVEEAVRALLVVADDVFVAKRLEPWAETELDCAYTM